MESSTFAKRNFQYGPRRRVEYLKSLNEPVLLKTEETSGTISHSVVTEKGMDPVDRCDLIGLQAP